MRHGGVVLGAYTQRLRLRVAGMLLRIRRLLAVWVERSYVIVGVVVGVRRRLVLRRRSRRQRRVGLGLYRLRRHMGSCILRIVCRRRQRIQQGLYVNTEGGTALRLVMSALGRLGWSLLGSIRTVMGIWVRRVVALAWCLRL
jgi:hypothetical protein